MYKRKKQMMVVTSAKLKSLMYGTSKWEKNAYTLFMQEIFPALIKILFKTFQKLKRNGTK
jgi:hypothetical protein